VVPRVSVPEPAVPASDHDGGRIWRLHGIDLVLRRGDEGALSGRIMSHDFDARLSGRPRRDP